MEKKLKFFFDREGDVLDISIGCPTEAISKELGDDIIVRIDTNNIVVGITILNFQKRFEKITTEKEIPIEAKFVLTK